MKSDATTVKEYLDSLPEDRRKAISAVRREIRKRLPKGYVEAMQYGMIGYSVPLRRYPETYNGQPLNLAALASKMGLGQTMTNTLALMAAKRRLHVLPQLVDALRDSIARDKGEVTAEVTSATPLTPAQSDKLAETLKSKVGKTVKIKSTVDESLIGGLAVKVGSKMIDTSIRSKLASLQNAMKEVG